MSDIDFNFQDSDTQKEDEKLIEDRSKLELAYIPEKIRHREDQIKQLARSTLSDVANGKKGTDAIVFGPPGTGKTATVKHLCQQTEINNTDTSKFNIEYLNCSTNSSSQAVFRELCKRVDAEFKQGVEISKNIDRFKQGLERQDYGSLLIVLDEVQDLKTDRRSYLSKPVLYQLSRPGESNAEQDFDVSITVIAISNDENILEYIDKDVKSSLEGPKSVHFSRYTEDEIIEILQQRQLKAYTEPVLSKPAIRKIAREVSDNFDGDVRKGIEILKKVPKSAGDVMKLKDDQQDQIDVVDTIITDLQKDRIRSAMYAEEEDFYIVMHSLYQQIIEGKARLKYITESYGRACEMARREKKGDSWNARKSWVYRQLEKLVENDLLEKRKDHREQNKPNRYEIQFDAELFREIVEDMLERKQLLKQIESGDHSVSELSNHPQSQDDEGKKANGSGKPAEDEFNDLMEDMGYPSES